MRTIKPIPQVFLGTVFRSKTEALFARWCHEWGLKYEYEPEAFHVGNICYLPDFWIPSAKIVVEIKPKIFHAELTKLRCFVDSITTDEDGMPPFLIEGISVWVVEASIYGAECNFLFRDQWWESPEDGFLRGAVCGNCMKPFFVGSGSYRCPGCGAYDGSHHFWTSRWGNLIPFPTPTMKREITR